MYYRNNHHKNYNDMDSISLKKKIYCFNCGKNTHLSKNCPSPITSYGIILFYPYNPDKFYSSNMFVDKIFRNYTINQNDRNGNDILTKFDSTKLTINSIISETKELKSLKYLLILDRYTPDYVQIIKGNYSFDDVAYLKALISRLTANEIELIRENDLTQLYLKYSIFSNKNVLEIYKDEYNHSKDLFAKLKNGIYNKDDVFIKFDDLINELNPQWIEPDWGFPKGRRKRNGDETDIECAKREFKEETGIDASQYEILDKIHPIEENLIGSNGIPYRHVYYIAKARSYLPLYLNPYNKSQISEIRKIGWYSYEDCMNLIRSYHIPKKIVLTKIHHLITKNLTA